MGMIAMVERPTPLHAGLNGHDINVVRERIAIFPENISSEMIDEIGDGQKLVYVSIGTGETRVNVVDEEGRPLISWTAIFGWSSLCGIEIEHEGAPIHVDSLAMIVNALRGSLRRYGRIVDTSEFRVLSSARFKLAIGDILDQTIGDACEYDRIILAAPEGLHDILGGSLKLRPHIDPVIQDL